jgi:hypothetical protein
MIYSNFLKVSNDEVGAIFGFEYDPSSSIYAGVDLACACCKLCNFGLISISTDSITPGLALARACSVSKFVF